MIPQVTCPLLLPEDFGDTMFFTAGGDFFNVHRLSAVLVSSVYQEGSGLHPYQHNDDMAREVAYRQALPIFAL